MAAENFRETTNVFAIPTPAMATFTSNPPVALTPSAAQPPKVADLFARMVTVVEFSARALPFVDEAWLREDGKEFVLIGKEWLVEAEECAAELSVALQRALAPDYDVLIEGRFQPRCPQPLDGFRCVFAR